MSTPALFPIFLKLEGRNCLVVGGGPVGESKVRSLLAAGARVTLVAPQITAALKQQAVRGLIVWKPREFAATDLEGAVIVIAASADDQVNQLIFDEAERRSILCNAVDQPSRCHFYFPAVVRRGALQIAISTGGLSPSLAKRLRQDLEEQFGPEYEEWLMWLRSIRAAVMQSGVDFDARKRLLEHFASKQIFATLPGRNTARRSRGKLA
jgi:precorrin-2 dehydrogenase / sirohydrochlorin ferrochelatase